MADIYAYYKKFGYATEIMGASFRNTGQILALAGCDLLTISPELLQQLANNEALVDRRLSPEKAAQSDVKRLNFDEKNFRRALNDDAMATEKLAEGIRLFCADAAKLDHMIRTSA